jgi:hypothetical protein
VFVSRRGGGGPPRGRGTWLRRGFVDGTGIVKERHFSALAHEQPKNLDRRFPDELEAAGPGSVIQERVAKRKIEQVIPVGLQPHCHGVGVVRHVRRSRRMIIPIRCEDLMGSNSVRLCRFARACETTGEPRLSGKKTQGLRRREADAGTPHIVTAAFAKDDPRAGQRGPTCTIRWRLSTTGILMAADKRGP